MDGKRKEHEKIPSEMLHHVFSLNKMNLRGTVAENQTVPKIDFV
jgi:hypothetical protein